jgi:glycosyltransferase involved in cell wall biosynthesis
MTKNLSDMRVAVVHDWMFTRRGGERVLERILNLFPQADLFVLFGEPERCLITKSQHKVVRSFLAKLPRIEKYYKYLLPLLPLATESHDLSNYDLVLSSSSCAAKGVICHPHATHVAYIHSPMRYAWDMELSYFPPADPKRSKWKNLLLGPIEFLRRILLSKLRIWDVSSSARVDVFCANSLFVKRRIELYYRRLADIVHPPVDFEIFRSARMQRTPLQRTVLLFGAWVPYKRMDWALKGLRSALPQDVHIIAAGHGELFEPTRRAFAEIPGVEFIESPSGHVIEEMYLRSHVLAFPGIEDFGIIPVEAMSAGVWVVGPNRGGTNETILDGVTGFLFDADAGPDQMMAALISGVNTALTREFPGKDDRVEKHLEKFSGAHFDSKLLQIIAKAVSENAVTAKAAGNT